MIAKLRGLLDSSGEDWAVIDVGGVGYQVTCTRRTLGWLLGTRPEAEVLVHTSARENAVELIGFRNEAERGWFRALLTVQGIGAKTALATLDALGPAELEKAVAAGDAKAITRAHGIGARAASRIVAELRHRAEAVPTFVDEVQGSAGGVYRDAVDALEALGYSRIEAVEALSGVPAEHSDGSAEDLVRHALKAIGR
jgi:Holliday junction DNA helicase RuvA